MQRWLAQPRWRYWILLLPLRRLPLLLRRLPQMLRRPPQMLRRLPQMLEFAKCWPVEVEVEPWSQAGISELREHPWGTNRSDSCIGIGNHHFWRPVLRM
jgi:hypothetical protein